MKKRNSRTIKDQSVDTRLNNALKKCVLRKQELYSGARNITAHCLDTDLAVFQEVAGGNLSRIDNDIIDRAECQNMQVSGASYLADGLLAQEDVGTAFPGNLLECICAFDEQVGGQPSLSHLQGMGSPMQMFPAGLTGKEVFSRTVTPPAGVGNKQTYQVNRSRKIKEGKSMVANESMATVPKKVNMGDENQEQNGKLHKEEITNHQLQLNFSPEAYERLQEIFDKAGVKSIAEVIRNALRLYEWFLEQKQKGAKIQIVEDKLIREIEILL